MTVGTTDKANQHAFVVEHGRLHFFFFLELFRKF